MYVDAHDNYSETELKKTEQVFASSGSLTPREAAGMPGKAMSDSSLLPCIIYEWLCITCVFASFQERLSEMPVI